MNAIYKFFRSVKLAVVLITVITVYAILGTLVQQGQTQEFYQKTHGPFLAWLIDFTDTDRFTQSPIFLVPVGLFIINLGTCTVARLVTRAKNKAVKHFGPDIIHISLLLLAIGALTTTAVRREQDFWMAAGDAVNLPGGYTMTLSSLSYEAYENGRPKEWTSVVDLSKDGKLVKDDWKIEVNHPLSLGLLKVYQMNYGQGVMKLSDPSGQVRSLIAGQDLRIGDYNYRFSELYQASDPSVGLLAHVIEWKDGQVYGEGQLAAGSLLGDWTVLSVTGEDVTGLRAAVDPGFITVLVSLILMMVGMTMASIHKSKGVN